MAKIEAGNTSYFLLDGIPKQRGNYEPIVDGNNVGLKRLDGSFIANGDYDQWTDANDIGFASLADLLTFFKSNIFLDTSLL